MKKATNDAREVLFRRYFLALANQRLQGEDRDGLLGSLRGQYEKAHKRLPRPSWPDGLLAEAMPLSDISAEFSEEVEVFFYELARKSGVLRHPPRHLIGYGHDTWGAPGNRLAGEAWPQLFSELFDRIIVEKAFYWLWYALDERLIVGAVVMRFHDVVVSLRQKHDPVGYSIWRRLDDFLRSRLDEGRIALEAPRTGRRRAVHIMDETMIRLTRRVPQEAPVSDEALLKATLEGTDLWGRRDELLNPGPAHGIWLTEMLVAFEESGILAFRFEDLRGLLQSTCRSLAARTTEDIDDSSVHCSTDPEDPEDLQLRLLLEDPERWEAFKSDVELRLRDRRRFRSDKQERLLRCFRILAFAWENDLPTPSQGAVATMMKASKSQVSVYFADLKKVTAEVVTVHRISTSQNPSR